MHSSLRNHSQKITISIHLIAKNYAKSTKKTKLKRKLELISSHLNTVSSSRFKTSLLPKLPRKKNKGCARSKTKISQASTKTRTLQPAENTGTSLKTMTIQMVSTLGAESSLQTTSKPPLAVSKAKKSILTTIKGLLVCRNASNSTGD